jgi:hypothetical protein
MVLVWRALEVFFIKDSTLTIAFAIALSGISQSGDHTLKRILRLQYTNIIGSMLPNPNKLRLV